MAECLVNLEPERFDFRPKTWGELLDGLDGRLAVDGRVVTAVRFDGVDQPSFRDPGVAAVPLDAVARIDVDAEQATALLRASLDAASDSLPELVAGIRLTAASLRAGAPDGPLQLTALVSALQTLIALTAATVTAADATLGTTCGSDAAMADFGHRLAGALEEVVTQQARADGAATADALDMRLAPLVAAWTDVLSPIRERTAA
ncbi:MAG: hypothetical protein AB7O28_16170 [Vicinamibacterales bacterium]